MALTGYNPSGSSSWRTLNTSLLEAATCTRHFSMRDPSAAENAQVRTNLDTILFLSEGTGQGRIAYEVRIGERVQESHQVGFSRGTELKRGDLARLGHQRIQTG